MKRVLLVFALLLVATGLVYAQAGVAGKWTGETPGRGGAAATPLTLELKVAGTTLTGTITNGAQPAAAISDGKLDGNKISFTQTISNNGTDVMVSYTGEVNGDELSLTRAGGGGRGGAGGGGGRGGAGGGAGAAPAPGGGAPPAGGGGGGRGGAPAPIVLKRAK